MAPRGRATSLFHVFLIQHLVLSSELEKVSIIRVRMGLKKSIPHSHHLLSHGKPHDAKR